MAESPSPTVHWGGLGYPDAHSKLELGYTGNRFTEFNSTGQRYNNINESMGINFGTVSWTQHWERFKGWSTNLTFGGGPTSDQPTRFFQNELLHDRILGHSAVPTDRTRHAFDFMVDGSITRWFSLVDQPTKLFVGVGGSTGSLYHEVFARTGIRGAEIGSSALSLLGWGDANNFAADFVRGFRWSAMGRIAQSYAGSAFLHVAGDNYILQTSLSWGIYDERPLPKFEIETGISFNSGFFVSPQGKPREELLASIVTIRVRNVAFETWNDAINEKDFGPTYGVRLTLDVYPWIAPLFH
ncbi:MAG TPA: hypothetical protein VLA67_10460 [Nitrospiraceae bacterium]|nr:hypothetical protein [Nitrospiraceae bacterium]